VLYSTLGYVGGDNRCGDTLHTCYRLPHDPVEGYCDTHWPTELWSTQAKAEGIVLEAALHWGSNSSVVNDPLGESGRIPLYVGLRSTWGSVDGDCVFPHISWECSLTGDSKRHKLINKTLALETEHLSPQGTCWGNMEGDSLTEDFEGVFLH
jgi:hypothetical protein